jgi:hypothetical protein
VSGPFTEDPRLPAVVYQPKGGRECRGREVPAALPAEDVRERQFYVVMHHMATVLWLKGKAVEGLTALSAVLERTAQEQGNSSAPGP